MVIFLTLLLSRVLPFGREAGLSLSSAKLVVVVVVE